MWQAFLVVTFVWAPEPDVQAQLGSEYRALTQNYVELARFEPLTLTWTPSEGFGAKTELSLSR